MKILSWNIRGSGSSSKRRAIKQVLCKVNPDIVVLQELKREEVSRTFVGSLWRSRFKEWLVLPALGTAGGILIMWDVRRVIVKDSLLGEFSVSILVEMEGNSNWWFSGVYGPSKARFRDRFWDELVGLSSLCGDKWCIGGDFNVVRNVQEKFNSNRSTRSMKLFDELVSELNLKDPPLRNGQFTWSNFRDQPVCCRLDRFLHSVSWEDIFPYFRQEVDVRVISDHCPVILDSAPPSWGPTPFRFENMWLHHQLFPSDFARWWTEFNPPGWEGYKLMTKLKLIKGKLKKWNVDVFGDTRLKKQSMLKRIKELDILEPSGSWNSQLKDERFLLKSNLEKFILDEERALRMKSKFIWAKEGDANSKLFHSLMNARKAKNSITKLESEDGRLVESEEDIVQEITSFFRNLYKTEELNFRGIDGIQWQPIPQFLAEWLERPFQEDEIKRAIHECDGNKAPGPDGFTLKLFQSQWETMKDDVMKVFADFEKDGIIHGVTNETYICLIPKKGISSKVKDFRPISLVTSLYKIIAKVLSSRLKEVLPETIGESQGAFVAGRQILDTVLVANEVVEDYRKGGRSGVVFKIDFEKAYDFVEWGFLDFVLEKKGFGFIWRKWIMGCLSTVSFSVFVNGRPRGKFRGSRGLRQGDPLSPFLFTLVVDVLGRLIDKAVQLQVIQGFIVGREKVEVSHLQFADDTLLFMGANHSYFTKYLSILELFGSISGLRVNLKKSTILGINTDPVFLQNLADMSGCVVGEWPIKYLGLPLGGNPRKTEFWEPVLSKVAKRLGGWKKSFLSRGGRLTLIQSVLSSLPTYYLSLFKAPITVITSLEKLMRNFFWEGGDLVGGDHLVRWEKVCQAKENGGLGIGNLEMRNNALLLKWLWRFPKESHLLWYKVIRSKFGISPNQWDSKVVLRGTFKSPWKAISSLYGDFHQMVSFKIGKGNKVRFWEDIWEGEATLKSLFPSLFRLSTRTSRPIADFVDQTRLQEEGVTSWNLHFFRNLQDREISQLQGLLQRLDRTHLCNSVEDNRIWLPDSTGSFSCKSAFAWLRKDDSSPTNFQAKGIWKLGIPVKVKVFSWLLVLGKLNVHANLQARKPYLSLSPGWCILCKKNNESIDHLFLHCDFSYSLWCKLLKEFDIQWVIPRSCSELLTLGQGFLLSKKGKILWNFAVNATFWAIWLERNNRIFEDSEANFESIWDRIRLWVAIWIHVCKDFKSIPFSLIIRDWNPFL